MSDFARLAAALATAAAPVAIWWRDDDAGRCDPRLERLLALATGLEVPVALAVVPAWLEPATVRAIRAAPRAAVLQHGWAHADHSRAGERRLELGGAVEPAQLLALLEGGRRLLEHVFAEKFLPVMVPPWNRASAELRRALPAAGFHGYSGLSGDRSSHPAALPRLDVAVDVVRVVGERSEGSAVAALADSLAARIETGGREPIGLMTHHLVMDEAAFAGLGQLLGWLRTHERVTLAAAGALIAAPR